MKRWVIASALACSLMGAPLIAAASAVTFNWFEYTGRDNATFAPPVAEGQFRNPILAGFYPDPSICKVGEDYYLINSTFAYFPGIPIFHSKDLINWKQIGHVIDRPSQIDYQGIAVTRGLFAPAISYHDGTFYVVCTMVDGRGNFLVTAKDPAGPWSDPVWLDFDGIDPSLFFDNDGRAWMVNNGGPPDNTPLYSGHRAIWIQEFDISAQKLIGPRSIIVNGGADITRKPVWIEGPHLYKRGEWYYLSCAEGGTGDEHSQVILRSKSPTGPFVAWDKNPILTQRNLDGTTPGAVTCAGHADLIEGPDGNWWSVFLACRPFAKKFWMVGRETFLLPVMWTEDGWPQILPLGKRIPATLPTPKIEGKAAVLGQTHLNGNFTWRDEFSAPEFNPEWIMLRAPTEPWWTLANGALITPRSATVSGKDNPSFLARRVQHARFDVSTQFTAPIEPGVSAGLALFQNETHHFFVGVRLKADKPIIVVERADGNAATVIAQSPISKVSGIRVRISATETKLNFSYAIDNGEWTTLASNIDATPVMVQSVGLHFTGAVVGPYSWRETEPE